MDTSMENISYKSVYKQLKTKYERELATMLQLEDEKNKAIEQQQHLQIQNEALTKKLELMEVTLNDLRNQIKDLKDELEKSKLKNSRNRKYSEQDAILIRNSLKKYGGTLTFRQAATRFNISTSTIQLLMKEYE